MMNAVAGEIHIFWRRPFSCNNKDNEFATKAICSMRVVKMRIGAASSSVLPPSFVYFVSRFPDGRGGITGQRGSGHLTHVSYRLMRLYLSLTSCSVVGS